MHMNHALHSVTLLICCGHAVWGAQSIVLLFRHRQRTLANGQTMGGARAAGVEQGPYRICNELAMCCSTVETLVFVVLNEPVQCHGSCDSSHSLA